METILSSLRDENQVTVLICLMLAVMRIYLEVIEFDFKRLALTKLLHHEAAQRLHQAGFYFSVGYLLLFGPTFFLL